MKRIISVAVLLSSLSFAAQGVTTFKIANGALTVYSFKEGVEFQVDFNQLFAKANAEKVQYDPKSCVQAVSFRDGSYPSSGAYLASEEFMADDGGYRLIESGEDYGVYLWKGKKSVKDKESKSFLKFHAMINKEFNIQISCNAIF